MITFLNSCTRDESDEEASINCKSVGHFAFRIEIAASGLSAAIFNGEYPPPSNSVLQI